VFLRLLSFLQPTGGRTDLKLRKAVDDEGLTQSMLGIASNQQRK
jgi:hypothetical protein